jgi:hypothetical protein
MIRLTSRILILFTLVIGLSAAASAQDTHSVWSDRPLMVKDWATGQTYNSFVKGDAAFAWTQGTVRAYAHALAIVTPNLRYDFMLISITSTNVSTIEGRWNVRRNGVVVCGNCVGKAYLLDQAVGNYFKIYVGTPAAYAEHWHYSGYITSRFDF